MNHLERELSKLEQELEESDTAEDRKEILRLIREVERELSDHQDWLDDGYDRGWL